MESSRYRLRQVRREPRLIGYAVRDSPEQYRWLQERSKQGGWGWRRVFRVVFVVLGLLAVSLLVVGEFEARTSHFQARYFAEQASLLGSTMGAGASEAVGLADVGPLDQRLGYAQLPEMLGRLEGAGFGIVRQARWSDSMLAAQKEGLFAVYPVKYQAGLALLSEQGALLYGFKYPQKSYAEFEDIPELVVQTLLFIEDRGLLDEDQPMQNPAIAPKRLVRAVLDKSLAMLGSSRDVAGGSTLATQLEKFSHSPAGRTDSVGEKIRQMRSASLRAYLGGPQTLESRRAVVRDYVNSVPLGARRGRGEVHGIGDGLEVWLGYDFARVNRVLAGAPPENAVDFEAYAKAYRGVLMMLLAQQRPAAFLPNDVDRLNARADVFLGLLAGYGVISERLHDAAVGQSIGLAGEYPAFQIEGGLVETPKTLTTWQQTLRGLLGVENLYALERMDVSARVTLDVEVQRAVEDVLVKLGDPGEVRRRRLNERKRVGRGPSDEIVYSVFVVERGEDSFDRVRVQTDTLPENLDMNEGSKLDLGSTAKLRVLVHYLEVVEALHEELASVSGERDGAGREDVLTRWAERYLRRNPGASRESMLRAAMGRRYSVDPDASFMTGGGEHRFGNVVEIEGEEEEDEVFLSVRDAFRVSANLPFVRMLRDVVNYHITRLPEGRADMLEDVDDPRRALYLERFARTDAQKHVRRFYDRYYGLDSAEAVRERLDRGARWSAGERALVEVFLEGGDGSALYRRGGEHSPNPIELFVVRHLMEAPEASLADVMAASAEVRERAGAWILWEDTEVHQKRWIRYGLEEEAFEEIVKAWRAVGFPFARMVPSYASALGASADRPAALAELMGIIQAGGVRRPIVRIEEVSFGEGTPYETHLGLRGGEESERVMSVEVAAVLREVLGTVAARGTGRHGRWRFEDGEGNRLAVRGKTGTGDNRHKLYNRNGRVVGYRTTNRTATWAFMIGECFYGTVVAYVPGEAAKKHTFMSELSVRVLAELEVALEGLLVRGDGCVEEN